jgi:RNA polymerase sigma-70 factor, ECF subfamily
MTLGRAKRNGGADEFERMYVEHRERLFGFLVYRTGDRALAEDLLGDVFERAFRARSRFDPQRGSETTWLYAIAVNRLRDHQRRAHVERAVLERAVLEHAVTAETTTVDPPDDTIVERDRVMQALTVLNQRDREIIALRFGADLTAPQIARVTDQPLTTVEGRLFRALRRLGKVVLEDDVKLGLEDGATDTSDEVVILSPQSAPSAMTAP